MTLAEPLVGLESVRYNDDHHRFCVYGYVRPPRISGPLGILSNQNHRRIVGLSRHDEELIDQSFDILSLEALFMIPRVASILSLSPYWGTLIPCLKAMGKDFIKLVLSISAYCSLANYNQVHGSRDYPLPRISNNVLSHWAR